MSTKLNTLYPGLPNYRGPTKGWYTLLHHSEKVIEWSDNVMERIDYIVNNKETHEVQIRLSHIVYLDPKKFTYENIDHSYIRKNIQELTNYLHAHVKKCKWDGVTLMFPKKVGDGNGYGSGDGYGNGYGDGNGCGNGDGDGNGNGYGYGNGYGNG